MTLIFRARAYVSKENLGDAEGAIVGALPTGN